MVDAIVLFMAVVNVGKFLFFSWREIHTLIKSFSGGVWVVFHGDYIFKK